MNDINNQHAKKDGQTDADDQRAREAKKAAEEADRDHSSAEETKKKSSEEKEQGTSH